MKPKRKRHSRAFSAKAGQRSLLVAALAGAALLFSLAPAGAAPESILTCHCFRERSYNPEERFAADDYILATSFNSLLARAFALPKREIVMLKMGRGVNQDDLLVALEIGRNTGINLGQLLDLNQQDRSWAETVSRLVRNGMIQKGTVPAALTAPQPAAGAWVAERIISAFHRVPQEVIARFRETGLNDKEINLLLLLARTGKRELGKLAALSTREGRSWSEIAHQMGIEPEMAGRLILQPPAGER